mmetsp:Transcript_18620/g.30870  ORF Transcript_18620/g.30870 Transcript_18620/m.30870 type:complete len:498 (+) Transcript_18620:74-1567(+)|eukprot:CAMPEP_0119016774 /NCGR_PEP_ID=MMETSP1176-20130426/14389_1 /TAXON_ID=265551 /ORGANISM="Synedropsis recta cf, Strain CCMP1620" /LENGTH=497 /DNA_ID=CAMNT_0006970303 /DNA_START=24 /DNA_END=1517 /DNA_ORIENTATION=-
MSSPPPAPPGEISIDDAIEKLGYGRFQIRVMIAAGLCFAADAMEVLLLSFLSVVLQALWELTAAQTALLTSIVFLGQFLGTLVLGPLGDRIGRRPVFLLAAVIITIFGVATAFCNTFGALVVVRMLVGFGVGGLTVAFDTLAELLPVHARGRDLLFIDYFWTLGTLLVPVAAYVTLGEETNANHDNENGWRYFVVLCALPCFISVIMGAWLVPESPRWLLTQNKADEALAILRKGAVANRLDPYAVFPEGTTLKLEEPEASTMLDLFTPTWRWITIPMWVTWAGFAFLYYGTILATTSFFSEAPVDSEVSDAYTFDYGAIFVAGSAEIFGTTFAILTVDTWGRRPVQVISYTLGGICIIILGVFAKDDSLRSAMITFAFFARLFMMAGNITTWVATAEILTTEIRTTGHSCANAMARLGGFAAPYLVSEARDPLTIGGIMFGVAMVTAFTASRLPETKGKVLGMHLQHPLDHADNVGTNGGGQVELPASQVTAKPIV